MILKTGYRPNANSAVADAPSVGEFEQRLVETAGLFVSQTRVHDFGQPISDRGDAPELSLRDGRGRRRPAGPAMIAAHQQC